MEGASNTNGSIQVFIAKKLEAYFNQLQGKKPCNVHSMVVGEAEEAVIGYAMKHCNNNQSQAADILGVSRGTLRTKIQKYRIQVT